MGVVLLLRSQGMCPSLAHLETFQSLDGRAPDEVDDDENVDGAVVDGDDAADGCMIRDF